MQIISEKTLIPLSLAGIATGAVIWLTTLYAAVDTTRLAVNKIEVRQDRYSEDIQTIKIELEKIHGELRRINGYRPSR